MAKSETVIRELLELADVQINGSRPWDMQVHDTRLYDRILRDSSLGSGRSLHGRLVGLRCARRIHQPGPESPPRRKDHEQPAPRLPGDPRQAVQPPVLRPGFRGGRTALRPGQRPVLRHARQTPQLHLRLLEGRPQPGRSPGGQARPGLPGRSASSRACASSSWAAAGAVLPNTPPKNTAPPSWA